MFGQRIHQEGIRVLTQRIRLPLSKSEKSATNTTNDSKHHVTYNEQTALSDKNKRNFQSSRLVPRQYQIYYT